MGPLRPKAVGKKGVNLQKALFAQTRPEIYVHSLKLTYPLKIDPGKGDSDWKPSFLGAMLVSGSVGPQTLFPNMNHPHPTPKPTKHLKLSSQQTGRFSARGVLP